MPGPAVADPPRVSVLMCALAPRRDFLEQAVDSVLRQSFADFELVVVETGSTGAVAEVLGAAEDPRVRHEVLPPDTALAVARNHALGVARGELAAWLDADDVCETVRLERQVEVLDRSPDVDVVGSQVVVIDGGGEVLGLREYPTGNDEIRRALRRRNPLAQPAVTARRATLLRAGGYRDRPGGVCEDYELWCRLAARGARFANHPEALVRYRVHGGSMKAHQLRGTLRDTVRIKLDYFQGAMTRSERARLLAERALLCLPPSWVRGLFLRLELRGGPGSRR